MNVDETTERALREPEARAAAGLTSLPSEIIDLIAFYCANDHLLDPEFELDPAYHREMYATPPSGLLNLLLLNRRLYSLLNTSSNPGLYSRIFRSKFDAKAIARRFGSAAVSTRSLTKELQKRCICLKRIRRAVSVDRLYPDGFSEQSKFQMEECLWLAFMMMMENDGLNILQLRWARLRKYLTLHHSEEMFESALRPLYPEDSPDRALALHLYYLLSDPSKLRLESRNESDERLLVLRPFVFAAHRYEAYFAPWSARILPLHTEEGSSFGQETGMNPFLADLRVRSRCQIIEHCGQKVTICPPNTTHAACFAFFNKVELDPAVTGLPGLEESNDLLEAVVGRERNSILEERLSAKNPLSYVSKDHDRDMQRLMRCTSPQKSLGLNTVFHLGTMEGSWEGRFAFFNFDSYRDMLGGKLRSLYEGQFGEQPQVWKIKEHIVKLNANEPPGGTGETLNSGYKADNDEPTDRNAIPLSEVKKKMKKYDGDDIFGDLFTDDHPFPAFDEEEQGDTPLEEDSNEDRYEILLSGTGHSAWGRFTLRGRVRSWDGMLTMTKEYRPESRGRWLYRGYVVAGNRMVGRWRDTFTPETMSGYEG
ncbi:hypothetical protein CBS101457_004350 [Exobasidium rhododendri]|nr:hypothetical protein CBS101457_004350 [Exobasidium rhododendri]